MIVDVRANHDVTEWLDRFHTEWLRARGHRTWTVEGAHYAFRPDGSCAVDGVLYRLVDGIWYSREYRPEEESRTPDLVVSGESFGKVVAARPSQGDVDDALRGVEGVEVTGPDGVTRTDYPNVPLKNADGTPTKYARNLADLHAPSGRASAAMGEEMGASMETLKVEHADGREATVPVKVAEPLLREGKVREKKKRASRKKGAK